MDKESYDTKINGKFDRKLFELNFVSYKNNW